MKLNNYFIKLKKKYLITGLALALILILLFLGTAYAATDFGARTHKTENSIITLPWKDKAKRPVPPSFILPTQARWGCLSCHSSKRLSKFRDGKEISLFIDQNIIGNSMHKKIACLDCHTNFSYDKHPAGTPQNWRKIAGLACMKCHPYQAYLYRKSIHGKLALQNKKGKLGGQEVDPPTCFDCHGNHDVQSPRFEPYRTKFKESLNKGEVCAKCHKDRYKSWNDYYHGRAFKNGAKDAPACWDCHNNHLVLKAKNPESSVNENKMPKTCGLCHDRPTKAFTSYASLIHGRKKIVEGNPIVRLVRAIIPGGGEKKSTPAAEVKQTKEEVNQAKSESIFTKIIHFFYPPSLRSKK